MDWPFSKLIDEGRMRKPSSPPPLMPLPYTLMRNSLLVHKQVAVTHLLSIVKLTTYSFHTFTYDVSISQYVDLIATIIISNIHCDFTIYCDFTMCETCFRYATNYAFFRIFCFRRFCINIDSIYRRNKKNQGKCCEKSTRIESIGTDTDMKFHWFFDAYLRD